MTEPTDDQKVAFIRRVATAARSYPGVTAALVVIAIAQAIQESGWGTSELSTRACNFYGAAADLGDHDPRALPANYTLQNNWEVADGQNQYGPRDFYAYPSMAASVASHLDFITGRTGVAAYQQRPIPDDPKALAAWLCTAPRAYATDPGYVPALCKLIDRWQIASYAQDALAPTTPGGTMTTSQNGWQVIPDYLDAALVNMRFITGQIRGGDTAVVLGWVADRYNSTVEPIRVDQSWGYAPRKIAGSSTISNHASGTAIDINSSDHPQHADTMDAAHKAACRAIVEASKVGVVPVVRWGGDYPTSQLDQMHFEIGLQSQGVTPAMVATLAQRIRGDQVQAAAASVASSDLPTIRKGSSGDAVRIWTTYLHANYSYAANVAPGRYFGGDTDKATREFQRRCGLTADGIVGPKTWAAAVGLGLHH